MSGSFQDVRIKSNNKRSKRAAFVKEWGLPDPTEIHIVDAKIFTYAHIAARRSHCADRVQWPSRSSKEKSRDQLMRLVCGGFPCFAMAAPYQLTLLLLFVARVNAIPTPSVHARRSENQDGWSKEAVLALIAIFVTILLFFISLVLPATRKRITSGSTSEFNSQC